MEEGWTVQRGKKKADPRRKELNNLLLKLDYLTKKTHRESDILEFYRTFMKAFSLAKELKVWFDKYTWRHTFEKRIPIPCNMIKFRQPIWKAHVETNFMDVFPDPEAEGPNLAPTYGQCGVCGRRVVEVPYSKGRYYYCDASIEMRGDTKYMISRFGSYSYLFGYGDGLYTGPLPCDTLCCDWCIDKMLDAGEIKEW